MRSPRPARWTVPTAAPALRSGTKLRLENAQDRRALEEAEAIAAHTDDPFTTGDYEELH